MRRPYEELFSEMKTCFSLHYEPYFSYTNDTLENFLKSVAKSSKEKSVTREKKTIRSRTDTLN